MDQDGKGKKRGVRNGEVDLGVRAGVEQRSEGREGTSCPRSPRFQPGQNCDEERGAAYYEGCYDFDGGIRHYRSEAVRKV